MTRGRHGYILVSSSRDLHGRESRLQVALWGSPFLFAGGHHMDRPFDSELVLCHASLNLRPTPRPG